MCRDGQNRVHLEESFYAYYTVVFTFIFNIGQQAASKRTRSVWFVDISQQPTITTEGFGVYGFRFYKTSSGRTSSEIW